MEKIVKVNQIIETKTVFKQIFQGKLSDWDAMRDSATGHELNLDSTVLTPNDFKKAMKSFLAENTDTKTLNEITKVDDHFYDDFYDDDYYYQVY